MVSNTAIAVLVNINYTTVPCDNDTSRGSHDQGERWRLKHTHTHTQKCRCCHGHEEQWRLSWTKGTVLLWLSWSRESSY